MELTVKDSVIIKRIMYDTFSKYLEKEDVERIYNSIIMRNENTNNLIHAINLLISRSEYARKTKDIIERFGDELASRIEIETNTNDVKIEKNDNFTLDVKIKNKFDVPLIFEIKLEDRDNFLPLIYDKIQDSYFNEVSEERLIDSDETKTVKFKIGSNENIFKGGTLLFLVVKSKEVEGLNLIHRIKVEVV